MRNKTKFKIQILLFILMCSIALYMCFNTVNQYIEKMTNLECKNKDGDVYQNDIPDSCGKENPANNNKKNMCIQDNNCSTLSESECLKDNSQNYWCTEKDDTTSGLDCYDEKGNNRCSHNTGWCLKPGGKCLGVTEAENRFSSGLNIEYSKCNLLSYENGCIDYGGKWCKPDFPSGSYTNTCSQCEIHGDKLECRCLVGGPHTPSYTSIDYKNCEEDISNVDGKLTCVTE